MSLSTFSKFYYGYEITTDNYIINFDEGGSELSAEVAVGAYTFTTFLTAIETALNSAGALTYTVTGNRTTRIITIAASGNFSLLTSTGTQLGASPFSLMGFTGADRTGDDTYAGNTAAGSSYAPQFILQDHVATTDWKMASQATVNKTADGRVEVVKFGDEQFMQANIKYATDIGQDGVVIHTNASGVANLRTFMEWLIKKYPIEYMADVDTVATFENLILESSPDSQNGTGYKLKELYDIGLPGYFETGILKFRVVEV
jgi:hypothetical protein